MMNTIVYGNLGGVYLKHFTLDNDTLTFNYTDLNLKEVYNPLLDELKLSEFLKCVGYFNKCVMSSSANNLINLESNLNRSDCFGDTVEMYKETSIIDVYKCDDYCIGVSLQKGDNKLHDFMVVFKVFSDVLPEEKSKGSHDELTVYKSYKDGKIKVIYFTREEVINIVSNCRRLLLNTSK